MLIRTAEEPEMTTPTERVNDAASPDSSYLMAIINPPRKEGEPLEVIPIKGVITSPGSTPRQTPSQSPHESPRQAAQQIQESSPGIDPPAVQAKSAPDLPDNHVGIVDVTTGDYYAVDEDGAAKKWTEKAWEYVKEHKWELGQGFLDATAAFVQAASATLPDDHPSKAGLLKAGLYMQGSLGVIEAGKEIVNAVRQKKINWVDLVAGGGKLVSAGTGIKGELTENEHDARIYDGISNYTMGVTTTMQLMGNAVYASLRKADLGDLEKNMRVVETIKNQDPILYKKFDELLQGRQVRREPAAQSTSVSTIAASAPARWRIGTTSGSPSQPQGILPLHNTPQQGATQGR
ncbi:hypothetical protein ACIPPJ_30075 [Streptomyces sp. NPDC086091]|uniref:hypothetical protein n=1 Tax=Streptomyces sp. NPDC086091 TaxID=3365751 RepID=UPI0038010E6A